MNPGGLIIERANILLLARFFFSNSVSLFLCSAIALDSVLKKLVAACLLVLNFLVTLPNLSVSVTCPPLVTIIDLRLVMILKQKEFSFHQLEKQS